MKHLIFDHHTRRGVINVAWCAHGRTQRTPRLKEDQEYEAKCDSGTDEYSASDMDIGHFEKHADDGVTMQLSLLPGLIRCR